MTLAKRNCKTPNLWIRMHLVRVGVRRLWPPVCAIAGVTMHNRLALARNAAENFLMKNPPLIAP
jgi:hypothetical protein